MSKHTDLKGFLLLILLGPVGYFVGVGIAYVLWPRAEDFLQWSWTTAFGGFAAGIILGIGLWWRARKKQQEQEAERFEERIAEDYQRRLREEQANLRKAMVTVRERALSLFESLPKALAYAEKWLN